MSVTWLAHPAAADDMSAHTAMTLSASGFSVSHTLPMELVEAANAHDSRPRHFFTSVRMVAERFAVTIALPVSISFIPHMPGVEEKNHSGWLASSPHAPSRQQGH
jgi:hypothetical protein